MSSETAAVLGTGLIGSSIGIGLRGLGWEVTGWDPDPAAMRMAIDVGALDSPAEGLSEAAGGADLVVLAGPVAAIVDTLPALATSALVTDVGGVKGPVVEAARSLGRFVGGHPMAGRETAGASGASGSLFRGASWVLTNDRAAPDDLDFMRDLVKSLGAVPIVMSAAHHDAAVAASSHLPHVVAAALVAALSDDPAAFQLAAGGFRDLTRVALSEPGWWVDVLVANRVEVERSLRSLASQLEGWAGLLSVADRSKLLDALADARRVRAEMAAPVASIGVVLEDRPGEMARVGHSLSESGVDLRDLQLRHATHGGGGVLTLSVRAAESEKLRSSLIADGFRLIDSR
ncbi:MAG: prephenate dehydrogenase/arogenate dehydrogenase family protein [Acidimicrobiia bacterium]|nr:prephenate dehydrogenase/arogenate dehydrogenase family protein [Acidimicrobiia bacterium]